MQGRTDPAGGIVRRVDTGTIIAIVGPLLAIQLVLAIVALRDLLQPGRSVRGGNKGLWALVIVFGEMLGPLIYFAVGRNDE